MGGFPWMVYYFAANAATEEIFTYWSELLAAGLCNKWQDFVDLGMVFIYSK